MTSVQSSKGIVLSPLGWHLSIKSWNLLNLKVSTSLASLTTRLKHEDRFFHIADRTVLWCFFLPFSPVVQASSALSGFRQLIRDTCICPFQLPKSRPTAHLYSFAPLFSHVWANLLEPVQYHRSLLCFKQLGSSPTSHVFHDSYP